MASPSSNYNDILLPHLDRLLSSRDYPKTICPSEIPRALTVAELEALGVSTWRDLMPIMRQILWDLHQRGEVEILQKGKRIPELAELNEIRGPIRARKMQ